MEIRRKINILIKTERRFVVRRSGDENNIVGERGGTAMRRTQTVADLSGVGSRLVYRRQKTVFV